MRYEWIMATPASPSIGAEINNIDLTKPLSEQQQVELRDALLQYQVIFLRNQHMSSEDLVRLGGYFGELAGHVGLRSNSKATDSPFVRRYHFDATSKYINERNFHSDQSCAEFPPAVSVLYNHTVPPDGGGDTLFLNMYMAYDALSEKMQHYLGDLTAVHDGTKRFGEGSPISSHPVIARHPVSGKKSIFVNSEFTTAINDIPEKEGRYILQFLYDHCARMEWSCRFRWHPHSIALWDNRCTLHKVICDYWPNVRSGYRVYVKSAEPPSL